MSRARTVTTLLLLPALLVVGVLWTQSTPHVAEVPAPTHWRPLR